MNQLVLSLALFFVAIASQAEVSCKSKSERTQVSLYYGNFNEVYAAEINVDRLMWVSKNRMQTLGEIAESVVENEVSIAGNFRNPKESPDYMMGAEFRLPEQGDLPGLSSGEVVGRIRQVGPARYPAEGFGMVFDAKLDIDFSGEGSPFNTDAAKKEAKFLSSQNSIRIWNGISLECFDNFAELDMPQSSGEQ